MRAVLTYHSLDRTGSPISLNPNVFRSHVDFLASEGVDVLPLDRLVETADQRRPAVAITFDDGFRNFATEAWPALAAHKLPATLFVVTGRTGGQNDWTAAGIPEVPRFPLLDWPDLARLAEEGVDLGAHTRAHRDLDGLSADELMDEIDGSSEDLRRETGRVPRTFAYPYGRFNPVVTEAVRARYSLACTTEMSWLTKGQGPHELPRLDMYYYQELGHLESIGSAGFRARIRYLATRRTLRARVESMMGRA